MRPEIVVRSRGDIILIISMIKTIEIREEETKEKDLEEDVSMENASLWRRRA